MQKVSPNKWCQIVTCYGRAHDKGGEQYFTGCGKSFIATFSDLYRAQHWVFFFATKGPVKVKCKHCGEPNHVKYSSSSCHGAIDKDDLSHVDRRFIDNIPIKYNEFFSKY